jgi:hypothetical protein
MFLVLLGFGTILSVAGIVLAGAGLSLRNGSFDAGLFTPGIVAAVGGLLLIGLGLALRALQQIERALAARPMPRIVQAPFTGATEASDESGEARMFAFPPQTKQAAAPAAVAAGTSDDQPAHAVTEASETRRLGNRSYPPLTKPAASASGETNIETDADHFGRRSNGAAAARTSPRLPIGARSSASTERSKPAALDAMWPKNPRPARGTQAEPVQNTGIQSMESKPEPAASPSAAAYDEPVPISVLRSGIVDGMAYTLYSDGSIEAELPQGTLRFGSITELRQHLEQGA